MIKAEPAAGAGFYWGGAPILERLESVVFAHRLDPLGVAGNVNLSLNVKLKIHLSIIVQGNDDAALIRHVKCHGGEVAAYLLAVTVIGR
jgi:hypothetical protein